MNRSGYEVAGAFPGGLEFELQEDVVLECREVGICYRKPCKLGYSHNREDREFWPFRQLNLTLGRGETLGIRGRNGAGKSTLLRLLVGVTHPDEGVVVKRPGLSIQLLSLNLGFERILSGEENAIMAGMFLGKSRSYMLSRIEAIREFSDLGDFFYEPVYSYSSGMRARLAFSIATEIEPDVLLLDELLSVGDAEFKERSKKRTTDLIKSGKTVVIVSHGKKFLESMCDRIIEL